MSSKVRFKGNLGVSEGKRKQLFSFLINEFKTGK